MAVTIQDVAKKAEVSPSTVSRVFNNKGQISEETQSIVLKAAKALGYRPRTNKLSKTKTQVNNIAIISSSLISNLNVNPFYGEVIEGIEQSLNKPNNNLLFKTVNGNQDKSNIIEELIDDEKLVGIIIVGSEIDRDFILKINEINVPLVLVDNDLWDENIDCVVNDNQAGARKAVTHLIELGHKKIGFICGPRSHTSLEERYMGYRQALLYEDIPVDENLVTFCGPTYTVEKGYEEIKKMVKSGVLEQMNKVSAIFTSSDFLAIGLMKAIEEMDLAFKDISIIGFDDIQMAKYINPSLSTVRIFKDEMGILAGDRLQELIEGKKIKPIKLIVSVELIKRKSCKTL